MSQCPVSRRGRSQWYHNLIAEISEEKLDARRNRINRRVIKQKMSKWMNPRLTPIDSPTAAVECFDAEIDCPGDKPVSGYFVRPKEARPKSLPAALFVHGAGVP